eukprot:scaffold1556_cov278-Prasinococcus_capsulatus_cf.AAC.5
MMRRARGAVPFQIQQQEQTRFKNILEFLITLSLFRNRRESPRHVAAAAHSRIASGRCMRRE